MSQAVTDQPFNAGLRGAAMSGQAADSQWTWAAKGTGCMGSHGSQSYRSYHGSHGSQGYQGDRGTRYLSR